MHSLHEDWLIQKPQLSSDLPGVLRLAKKANDSGEHLLAIEITDAALEAVPAPENLPFLGQKAIALARLGSFENALQTLEQIQAFELRDGNMLGLLGDVYRDLAAGSVEGDARRPFWEKSYYFYSQGFKHSASTRCGIDAAAQAVQLGDFDSAKKLAQQVLLTTGDSGTFQSFVTRAEASLILEHGEEALSFYRKACTAGGHGIAEIFAARKQCRDLSFEIFKHKDKFDASFPAGAVAVFAGHLIDAKNRHTPRFPESAVESVRQRIKAWLAENSVRVSFSSAACGSDIIFLSAAQEAGVETHVVLPFRAEDFLKVSVQPGGEQWVKLFEEVTLKAASTTILNDDVADEQSSAFDFSNRMVAAKGKLRAKTLDLPLRALSVWNLMPGDGRGGTADTVKIWHNAKISCDIIHPTDPSLDKKFEEKTVIPPVPFDRTFTAIPKGHRTAVCAVMHLYFAGYFGLREKQFASFQKIILDAISERLSTTKFMPTNRCGFGADYAFIFDSMLHAGMFASEVLHNIAKAMKNEGFEMEQPRICLHAGPLLLMVNPVLNQYSHEGSTLTRAGRIVRKAKPGIIYATEAFAALSALEGIVDFRFEYVGTAKYDDNAGQDRLFSTRFKDRVNAPQ